MDVHDQPTRSYNMSRIRGKSTKPEIQVRKICHNLGYRFRLHRKDLPGKPDLVFPKHHAAVFVNGCFWHGHDCHLFQVPATRTEFWTEKIAGTKARDEYQQAQLMILDWRVMVIWECALKGRGKLSAEEIADQIESWLPTKSRYSEVTGTEFDP